MKTTCTYIPRLMTNRELINALLITSIEPNRRDLFERCLNELACRCDGIPMSPQAIKKRSSEAVLMTYGRGMAK
jgi:hypothetical protein